MDFNFGNLVSAAVGAVTKVANAVIDFFSPIAEGGGTLGGLAGVAVDVAEAVLGAVPGGADVNGDREIDAEEVEKIVNDVLKVMLGGMIVAFGSVSFGSNSESNGEESAVKAQWIDPKTGVLTGTSPIESTYAIKIPKATTIYEGPVGYQGGSYLGGENCNQIFVSEPWKIDGVKPLSETPIK